MNYTKDINLADQLAQERVGRVLFEALPWMKSITGKTIVIKYGGAAMESKKLQKDVMSDIVLLKIMGVNPVIVHGGGSAINRAFKALSLPITFKDGQRVTSKEAMEVVRQVLVGEVNQNLVAALNLHGNVAVGVSGIDAQTIRCSELNPAYGCVGKIEHIDVTYLKRIIKSDYIPVLATIGVGDDGAFYNINADVAAGHIAAALEAEKIIYLTDVDGVYEDFSNKETLISSMSLGEMRALLDSKKIAKGMIPKLESCCYALQAGVARSFIINGKSPHSLLIELLTDTGIGTTMYDEALPENKPAS